MRRPGRAHHIDLCREGINTLILERGAAGGQVSNTMMMENYPGFDEGISGMEFSQRLTRQAKKFGVEIVQASGVQGLGRSGQYLCVKTTSGGEYRRVPC